MAKLKDLKVRLMEDPAFREEYACADKEFAFVETLVRARAANNLTQAGLPQCLSSTQSPIAPFGRSQE